jgi:hypothetical protein
MPSGREAISPAGNLLQRADAVGGGETKPPTGTGNLAWLRGVLDDPELKSRAKLVATAMAMVTDRRSMLCTIGTARLIERTALSERTIRSARADLTAAGWLRLLRRGTNVNGDTPSTYRLTFRRTPREGRQ